MIDSIDNDKYVFCSPGNKINVHNIDKTLAILQGILIFKEQDLDARKEKKKQKDF